MLRAFWSPHAHTENNHVEDPRNPPSPGLDLGRKKLTGLISRLRPRQFGIFATTSFVATQVYQELKEDDHPCLSSVVAISPNHSGRKSVALKTSRAGWIGLTDLFAPQNLYHSRCTPVQIIRYIVLPEPGHFPPQLLQCQADLAVPGHISS